MSFEIADFLVNCTDLRVVVVWWAELWRRPFLNVRFKNMNFDLFTLKRLSCYLVYATPRGAPSVIAAELITFKNLYVSRRRFPRSAVMTF